MGTVTIATSRTAAALLGRTKKSLQNAVRRGVVPRPRLDAGPRGPLVWTYEDVVDVALVLGIVAPNRAEFEAAVVAQGRVE